MKPPMSISSEVYFLNALANTSAAVTLTAASINNSNVLVYNKGTTDVFVTSGITSPTAVYPSSATVPVLGQVIPPGQEMTYTKPIGHIYIAGIRPDATTGSVVITVGEGE